MIAIFEDAKERNYSAPKLEAIFWPKGPSQQEISKVPPNPAQERTLRIVVSVPAQTTVYAGTLSLELSVRAQALICCDEVIIGASYQGRPLQTESPREAG